MISMVFTSTQLAFGQQALLCVQTEYTITGHQIGGAVGFESRSQWAVTAFLQGEISSGDELIKKNRFYGLQFQAPLAKTTKLSFFATLRVGLVNKDFFVAVPGLETRVRLGKRLAIGTGMAMRMGYPSISSKLLVKIF
jgi:hypothetical protein